MNALSVIQIMRAIRRLASAVTPGCNSGVALKFLEEARGLIDGAIAQQFCKCVRGIEAPEECSIHAPTGVGPGEGI